MLLGDVPLPHTKPGLQVCVLEVASVVASAHKYPSLHGSDCVMFAVLAGQERPAGQGSQLNTLGAPRRKEKVPSGQLEHETELRIAT